MSKLIFEVVDTKEKMFVFGLCQKSNDKTQAKDISVLAKKYYGTVKKKTGEVIPFFVISKDYNKSTRDFQLFVGGSVQNDSLEIFTIPKGIYGRVTIKPKLGFLWGPSIGKAKRTFYLEWLPKSDYSPLNMEYEHHTDASRGKNPQIDILFAIEKRSDS